MKTNLPAETFILTIWK